MVQLNDTELRLFNDLAKSNDGKVLVGYLDRLVLDAIDSRKIIGENKEAQLTARNLFASMVEENLINRLKKVNLHNKEKEDYT
jgi:hypothetical protein